MAQPQIAPGKGSQNVLTEVVEMPVWVPEAMEPGCLFLLPNRFQLQRQQGPNGFWAVLACPQCGTLGLITEQQHLGQHSVICGCDFCSCYFYIQDRAQFKYLPAH